MVTEKIPPERLMLVSVFNAAFSYREKSGRIFRAHPSRHAFGMLESLSVCEFGTIGIVIVSSA